MVPEEMAAIPSIQQFSCQVIKGCESRRCARGRAEPIGTAEPAHKAHEAFPRVCRTGSRRSPILRYQRLRPALETRTFRRSEARVTEILADYVRTGETRPPL